LMPRYRCAEMKINLHRNPLHKTSDIPVHRTRARPPPNFQNKLHNQIDPAAERRALRAREGHTLGAAVEQYLAAKADRFQ